jgi:hypothetical protein
MTVAEGERDGVVGGAQGIEVGGEIRHVVILTVRCGPWACYLARRLRPSGVRITLVSQRRFKIEPDSPRYFKRLLDRRGVGVFLDNLLLFLVKRLARLPRRVFRGLVPVLNPASAGGVAAPSAQAEFPVLREDPGIVEEGWLRYVEVDDINASPDQDEVRVLEPDLILLAGAPILSRASLGLARVGCLNAHCGITPDYAGNDPFFWPAYERRFEDVGYAVHLAVPAVDSGPVLFQERVAWDPSRQLGHLWPILAQKMYDKLAETALMLVEGRRLLAVPQVKSRILPPAGLFVRIVAEWRRARWARSRAKP